MKFLGASFLGCWMTLTLSAQAAPPPNPPESDSEPVTHEPEGGSGAEPGSEQGGSSTPQTADDEAEAMLAAKKLSDTAYRAYSKGQYENALELYERARAAYSNADITFNIARLLQRHLEEPERALANYQRALREPDITEARAEQARHSIEEVERELSARNKTAQETAKPEDEGAAIETAHWTRLEIAGVTSAILGVGCMGAGLATLHGEQLSESTSWTLAGIGGGLILVGAVSYLVGGSDDEEGRSSSTPWLYRDLRGGLVTSKRGGFVATLNGSF